MEAGPASPASASPEPQLRSVNDKLTGTTSRLASRFEVLIPLRRRGHAPSSLARPITVTPELPLGALPHCSLETAADLTLQLGDTPPESPLLPPSIGSGEPLAEGRNLLVELGLDLWTGIDYHKRSVDAGRMQRSRPAPSGVPRPAGLGSERPYRAICPRAAC